MTLAMIEDALGITDIEIDGTKYLYLDIINLKARYISKYGG